jgi:putative ABC transport system permease protein
MKRNAFIFVAILLTTCMIASTLSVAESFLATLDLQNVQRNGTAGHVQIYNVSERAVTQLKNMENIASVGLVTHVADVVFEADHFALFYYDEEYWQKHKRPALLDVQGRPPQTGNEIMLSRRFLFQSGITEPVLGMEVALNFQGADGRVRLGVFRLSGFYTDMKAVSINEPLGIPVSEAFLSALGDNAIHTANVSIIFENNRNIQQQILRMSNELYRPFASKAADNFNAGSPDMLMVIITVLVFLLMLTGFLLIYNILNISVANDIRLYGLLKTVGTTPRQIYRIVLTQALLLSIAAVPLGVGLGALVSYAFVPLVLQILGIQMTLVVFLSPVIFVASAALTVLTTFLGSLSPARKAARFSPVEATRYTEQEPTKKRVLFPTQGKPFLLAIRNIFFRNKKRMVTVFFSLFFSCVLFMTVAVISYSMDAEQYVSGLFHGYNFTLRHWPRDTQMVEIGPDSSVRFVEPVPHINEDYLKRLTMLPGFLSQRTVTRAGGFLTFTNEFLPYARNFHNSMLAELTSPEFLRPNFHTSVYGVCVEEVYAVRDLINPPIDMDAFARGETVLLFSSRNPHLLEHIEQIELTLSGGTFHFNTAVVSTRVFGDIRSFNFFGVPPIIVAKPFLEEHAMTLIYQVDIQVDETNEPLAFMELEILTEFDPEILFDARLTERAGVRSMQFFFWTVGGSVAGVIGLTGLLNFINVLSVGIMARKKELAAMESIGMTKKQVRAMLMYEGIGYAAVVLTAAAVFGNGIAIGLFHFLYTYDGTNVFAFRYPFILFTITALFVLSVCVCTPLITYGKLNKTTVVERLKE